MKILSSCFFTLLLFFSCAKNEIVEETTNVLPEEEIIDESALTFQEGFTGKLLNTNLKAIIEEDKSIIISNDELAEERLFKFHIPSQSNLWEAKTWYEEKAGVGNRNYHHDDFILFRQGHHDFIIDLENGSLLYDDEIDGCPSSSLVGFGDYYFSIASVIDSLTDQIKEIILIGDLREQANSDILVSPLYDSIGRDGKLGRIMGLHPFENEVGELHLAIRYFDMDPSTPITKDLFAVYNITQDQWEVEHEPLAYHSTGTKSVVGNGKIVFGSQSYVSCLDTKSGMLKWVTDGGALGSSNLLGFADGDFFLVAPNNTLERRNGETGNLVWQNEMGEYFKFIILNNKIFSLGDRFSIINIETGKILQSYSSPYTNYDATDYFNRTYKMMGFYDESIQKYYVYLNVGDDMISFEMKE